MISSQLYINFICIFESSKLRDLLTIMSYNLVHLRTTVKLADVIIICGIIIPLIILKIRRVPYHAIHHIAL